MRLDQGSTAPGASASKGGWREYTQLSRQVRQAGLLERRRGWYAARIGRNLAAVLGGGGRANTVLPSVEASLFGSYAEAVRHLHAVGAPLRPAVAE